jgi:hypothetical protein
VKLPLVWMIGAICGVGWWAVSLFLGAKAYGIVGTYPLTGAVSGVFTGAALAALSIPVYRRASTRPLALYSAVSVYLAILIYGASIFLLRSLENDFATGQIPWAVGWQSVLGMWWGVTFFAPIAIAVHVLAYANHRVLRSLIVG